MMENYATYAVKCTNCKKTQKYKYRIAGLRKIIEVKNKKLQNNVSFHSYINVTAKKSTTYEKFEKKKAKMTKKNL